MFKVEKTDFGVRLKISGLIEIEEVKKWKDEMLKALDKVKDPFNVFGDIQGFKPGSEDVQKIFVEVQKAYKDKGMKKSVVITDSTITKIQLKRTAKESGIYEWERYISSENNPKWEQQALDWITKNIDPDIE